MMLFDLQPSIIIFRETAMLLMYHIPKIRALVLGYGSGGKG
jgi:hypothetical protein